MEENKELSQEEKVQNKVNKPLEDDGVVKVDLRNFKEEQNADDEKSDVRLSDDDVQLSTEPTEPTDNAEVKEQADTGLTNEDEVRSSDSNEDASDSTEQTLLQEVEPEEVVEEKVEEVEETQPETVSEQKSLDLPENVEKLVNFMNETGGSLEDYVRLNTDVDSLNEHQLIKEYYKATKPHLEDEDISFLMEDTYSYDEDVDEEREVRRKKLLFKEEVQKAKSYLNNMKSKYYDEIKAGSRLTPDQQKAVDFFNRYTKENEESSALAKRQNEVFAKKTDTVFNQDFKGFEYKVGEKTYRFNVKDASKVKEEQSNLGNFTKKFLAKDKTIGDAKGYHKALFTAMNADAVANHFYQQGKADAIKESSARAKNVDMAPRGQHEPSTQVGGFKVRSVSGDDSGRLRIKINR